MALLPPWKIEYAAVSDRGNFRPDNEDHVAVYDLAREEALPLTGEQRIQPGSPGLLFLVADGVGGHACGEVASQLGSEVFAQQVRRRFQTGRDTPHAILRNAAFDANEALLEEMARDPARDGMATTLVVLWALPDRAYRAHIGDSRLYRLRHRRLHRVTRDHSPVEALLQAGTITEEQARKHPYRNIVDQVLGIENDHLNPEVATLELRWQDRYLLCSDGVSDALDDPHLRKLLRESTPASAAQASHLVEQAKRAGSRDNVTALVLRLQLW